MAVDLYDDGLVSDVQIALHDVSDLAVFLDHLVEDDCVCDDPGGAAIHPYLEVLRVACEPDGRARACGRWYFPMRTL